MSMLKKAGIIVAVILAALLLGLGTGGILGYQYAQHKAEPLPGDLVPQVNPVPGQACTITISDLRYYDEAALFIMRATAPGAGEGTIPRPERWKCIPPKNIFELGIGGGYHCGYWLPGGTISYLRRVGGLGNVGFYLGPELAISAIDARNVAVEIFGKAAAVW